MANGNEIVTVWWIDDDHADQTGQREAERAELIRQAGTVLNLVAIHPANFEDYATVLSIEASPDLLLIDFRLGMKELPGQPTPFFARDGVTLRGTMLGDSTLKDVPAYLVSGVIGNAQTGASDDHFDWVLSHTQLIERGGSFLLSDASDYRLLRECHAAASSAKDRNLIQQALVTAVCDLLTVPDASLDSVVELARHTVASLLRTEASLDSVQVRLAPSRPRAIAHWMRSCLQCLRGPLIDELAAANMLGANPDYFRNHLAPRLDLESVKYTGVFRRTATMTFWRQKLLQSVLLENDAIESSSPAKLARSAAAHFNVPPAPPSVCLPRLQQELA